MNHYYRAKLPACLDSMMSQSRMAPRPKAAPATLIGFLAQLFRESPEEKQRILDSESSEYIGVVELLALYRAGLLDDAQKFADKIGRSTVLRKMQADKLGLLTEVRPSSSPEDNDLLIGAYMASGDPAFIERIMENFSSADDGLAGDGLRMGFMQYKFGPTLVAKEREPVTVAAACEKYQCKTDPAKLYRLLTLSSAFWAMQALGKTDEGISKTVANFFERDKRLKDLLVTEQAALGNYDIANIVLITLKSDHSSMEADKAYAAMSRSMTAYETLGSARDAFAPIETLVKSGKKPNQAPGETLQRQ